MLLLLSACLAAQTGSTDLLSGTWINENQQTGGVTEVVVQRDQGHMVVHAWGACQPTDCDWGEAEPWNGTSVVIFEHGFSTTRMQLVPQPDGRMLVVYRAEYHDDSGRNDAGHAEFFARQQTKQSPDAAVARTLLKLVAETYRSLKEARFESTETVNRLTGKTESHTETSRLLLFSGPDRLRMETRGSGEQSILIDDGTTEWQVFPESNEYVRVPQANEITSGVLKYRLLDKARGTPRISEHEPFEGANCAVVQIDLERGIRKELWIDDATHLVRKELYEVPPTASNDLALKSQILYTVARTGEAAAPALFRYDPTKTQAQSRKQLSREAPISLLGKPAPEFTLHDLEGREVRLGHLRGKVVLLDFWGTWCGPCREALPSIELLHRARPDKGLVVLGIDAEPPELARDYLTKFGYTFRSLADPHDTVTSSYHIKSWPTTVLVDREGKVTYYEEGMELEKLRDALLKLGTW